jgi:hypothetical protein
VGDQSCDTPVAVEKWVYPQQPVMRRRSRYYLFSSSQTAVGVLEMGEEARHRAGGDGDMPRTSRSRSRWDGYRGDQKQPARWVKSANRRNERADSTLKSFGPGDFRPPKHLT